MLKREFVIVIVLCLFTVTLSHAQSRPNKYFGLETGIFQQGNFLQSECGTPIGSYEPNNGYDFGLKFTNYFSENVGIIVRISTINWDTQSDYFQSNFEFSTTSVALGLALRFQLSDPLDFIANAGVSYNANSYKYKGGGFPDIKDDGTALGYFIDAGLRFYLAEQIALGATLRYTINEQGADKLEQHLPTGVSVSSNNINFGGTSVLLDAGFMF
ncbi:MAG: porin family protein [Deferribacteraceae bacterium]|nr:porin family protein [Deferribacteraceae bacterium]